MCENCVDGICQNRCLPPSGKEKNEASFKRRNALIGKILLHCKTSEVPVTGDLFLGLAFRTEDELKAICTELYIQY
ncbi:hypothetical protein BOO92_14030 [Vibrio navarrensis]|nr:hypothetical protein [Vibrio navarrensis]